MRRVLVLFMFAVLTIMSGMVVVSSEVQAKGEGGGVPPGTKEVPPFIEGTLILLPGSVNFVGDCVKPFDTRFFGANLGITLDLVAASGDPIPSNNVEGFILLAVPVPSGCFKDGATSVNVVVKSVKNFAPVPETGGGRTSIVMRVSAVRYQ